MGKYFRATLNKRSGKKNYYAFVTVPKNLRPLLKGQRQIYKSTQTNDYEEARDKLRDLEAELYLKLDHAELANHPLSKAYDALWEGLDGLGFVIGWIRFWDCVPCRDTRLELGLVSGFDFFRYFQVIK